MNYEIVIDIAKRFTEDKSKIRVVGDWVMMSCPFAPYTHSNGTDKNPSFGINYVENTFNCFACGKSGRVETLPFQLQVLSGEDYRWLADLIISGSSIFVKIPDLKKTRSYTKIDFSVLEYFKPLNFTYKGIHPEMAEEFMILTNIKETQIIFPIITQKKDLIALKVRPVEKLSNIKSFYLKEISGLTLPSNKVKKLGVWYLEYLKPTMDILLLVEGERDAIFINYYTDYVAWASIGSKITIEQIKRLKKICNVETIALLFDNDKAGDLAREEVIKNLKYSFRLVVPENWYGCKDPAEAQEKGKLKALLSQKNLKEV